MPPTTIRYTRVMRALANCLNTLANTADNRGQTDRAITLYKLAALASPSWSVPHYNLGLINKNHANWHDSPTKPPNKS